MKDSPIKLDSNLRKFSLIDVNYELMNANKRNINHENNTTYVIKYKSNSNETKVNSIKTNK
jgi:hypothetical protein